MTRDGRLYRDRIRQGLQALGVRHFLLGIHDPAFPSRRHEDIGRGSPYSEGAADFLEFAAELGFDGIQFGPQGRTSASNPSPYDGTLFSRNPLSIAFAALTQPSWGHLLPADALERVAASKPAATSRVSYGHAFKSTAALLAQVVERWRSRGGASDGELAPLARRFDAFREQHRAWLERDALYDVLEREHGNRWWRDWLEVGRPHIDQFLWAPPPGEERVTEGRRAQLLARHADDLHAYALAQFIVHEQHEALRELTRALELKLFGDLQVGFSARDAWYAQEFLLRGYVMGAPPSRTNPEGQPWNYAVLDPALYTVPGPDGVPAEGPALRFLRARMDKMFAEFDSVRIDHPHGLVCPWVYRAEQTDQLYAVQQGARLFDSPGLPDHPELAPFAIARPDQINHDVPRYDDGWVGWLDEAQVEEYATLFDVLAAASRDHGRDPRDLVCEILSTQPYPLGRVRERAGLGRFRVTQKADLSRPDDVYRAENARAEDWIMMGNHDTPPIRAVANGWLRRGQAAAQAEYLASRLLPPGASHEAWVARVAGDVSELVQAKFADLFVGPATNIQVFFTDLFGLERDYNRPGTINDENWSLRVSPHFRDDYVCDLQEGRALDIPRAIVAAMRARGASFVDSHATLLQELGQLSARS